MSPTVERCPTCGFDAAAWNDTDTVRTLRHTGDLLALWADPLDGARFTRRPAAGSWSAADHVRQVALAHRALTALLATALSDGPGPERAAAGGIPGIALTPGPAAGGDGSTTDQAAVLSAAVDAGADLHRLLAKAKGRRWDRTVAVDGTDWPVRSLARRALHHLWHHLVGLGVTASRLAGRPAPTTGAVAGIHRSDGGVPKTAVASAEITLRGVVGDRQASRIHHGRPWQALCLWSSEVIEHLRAEGHPVVPGGAGENVTVAGVDWATLRAGEVVELGPVRCQLTAPAAPCGTIAANFADGDSGRIDHDRHPGVARWYASVLTPGPLTVGNAVMVRGATATDVAPLAEAPIGS